MTRSIFAALLFLLFAFVSANNAVADDPKKKEGEEEKPAFKLGKDVEKELLPLFKAIALADRSRATVELSAETLANGRVLNRQKSTYQIASTHPNMFTVYLKQPEKRTRVYCNGKDFIVALAPDAFFRVPEPLNLIDAVFEMPVEMGPYPEAVFALTFAGADPALTMLAGMESVEIVERGMFRGKVPSIQFKGVQDDGVVWNFWISREKEPKPLRLLVDLTTMLRENAQMKMPPGYAYELRFDFLTWRMSGEVDKKLFAYNPPSNATEYESTADYYSKLSGAASQHPLEAYAAPRFNARLLSGRGFTAKSLENRVLVLDFWASWCTPCAEAIPVVADVCKEYANKGVVFLPINVGESPELMQEYIKEQGWKIDPVVDEKMAISKAFKADVIPLTMLVSRTGVIESVHFGFAGTEALEKRLKDDLDVLVVGGKIASAPKKKPEEKQKSSASKQDRK